MTRGAQPWAARSRAWTLMRQLRTFTASDLVRAGVMGRAACSTFLRGLEQAGLVRREGHRGIRNRPGSGVLWHLVQDPPVLRSQADSVHDHQRLPAPPRQQAWTAMRIHRVFTMGDILRVAYPPGTINKGELAKLLGALERAGYVVRQGHRGVKGQPGWGIVWRLAKDTGPQAPQVTRDGRLVDRNLAGQNTGGQR